MLRNWTERRRIELLQKALDALREPQKPTWLMGTLRINWKDLLEVVKELQGKKLIERKGSYFQLTTKGIMSADTLRKARDLTAIALA